MKKLNMLAIAALMSLVLVPAVYAHCPLCTAAVGGGVAVTRFYGVDDAIVGVWIGAFIASTALWFNRVLKKKFVPLQSYLVVLLALHLTVVPFYFAGLMEPSHKLFGINKLLVGILSGVMVLYSGLYISSKLRNKKKKAFFPFQTMAVILALLSLASLLFWLVV
jgi:hypothetical protein